MARVLGNIELGSRSNDPAQRGAERSLKIDDTGFARFILNHKGLQEAEAKILATGVDGAKAMENLRSIYTDLRFKPTIKGVKVNDDFLVNLILEVANPRLQNQGIDETCSQAGWARNALANNKALITDYYRQIVEKGEFKTLGGKVITIEASDFIEDDDKKMEGFAKRSLSERLLQHSLFRTYTNKEYGMIDESILRMISDLNGNDAISVFKKSDLRTILSNGQLSVGMGVSALWLEGTKDAYHYLVIDHVEFGPDGKPLRVHFSQSWGKESVKGPKRLWDSKTGTESMDYEDFVAIARVGFVDSDKARSVGVAETTDPASIINENPIVTGFVAAVFNIPGMIGVIPKPKSEAQEKKIDEENRKKLDEYYQNHPRPETRYQYVPEKTPKGDLKLGKAERNTMARILQNHAPGQKLDLAIEPVKPQPVLKREALEENRKPYDFGSRLRVNLSAATNTEPFTLTRMMSAKSTPSES